MFLTIGFIVGFIVGWWVNEKVENLGEKLERGENTKYLSKMKITYIMFLNLKHLIISVLAARKRKIFLFIEK